jgi:hypothetical protein
MGELQGVGVGGGRKPKNPFLDLVYIEEVNKRNNKDFGLFENYQINPYTKKTRKLPSTLFLSNSSPLDP